MEVSRELAFFGGWTRRVLAGGSHAWGSPHQRVMELAPSSASSIRMPPASPWRQPGVPYWVINTGAAGLQIRNANDVLIDGAGLSAGEAGVLHGGAGESWHFRLLGAAQFGSVVPAQRMEIELASPAANVNLLQMVVARGYDGTQPIAVTCRVRTGVAIGTTSRPARSLWSGSTAGSVSWAAGSYWRLVVEPDATIGGWGGRGGRGGVPGTGASAGFAGENGGQAIRTEIPLFIDCLGNGLIFGGGGGGGGGGSSAATPSVIGGGGGGGRGVNMAPSSIIGGGGATVAAVVGSHGGAATAPANPGSAGGAAAAGQGGFSAGGGGYGGKGGNPGSIGAGVGFNGQAAPSAGAGGAGGTAGAAISYLTAAGAPTVLSGGSNIIGTTVAEAS